LLQTLYTNDNLMEVINTRKEEEVRKT